MPNYSHGTKMTLASVEEPPYLSVGTDVSAKYKGAFCEAKIIDVNKHVKLRVLFEGASGTYLINETDLKAGSPLETGSKIEAKHPGKKQQTYFQATVTKILDHSRYTVVFDDGDQCVLRRNSICLKSGKHFAESETLDQLPLTNPEHFGNPVKVGVIESLNNVQANINSKTQNNHQVANEKPKGKSSLNATNSSNSTTVEDNKSTLNNNRSEATIIGTGNRKRQPPPQDNNNDNIKKIKKERNVTTSNNSTTTTSTGSTRGKGASKGRQRRESVNNGNVKHSADIDDDSKDSSIDSADTNPKDSDVRFDLIEVGVKLMVQYGKGKVQNVYEAKVNKIETNAAGKTRYFVHYTGWNNRYDEWIHRNRILSIVTEKENGPKESSRTKQQQVQLQLETAANSVASSISSSSNSSSSTSTTQTTTTTTAPPTTSTSAAASSASSSSSSSTLSSTSSKDKDKERERDKMKDRERDRERDDDKDKEREREKEKEREKERKKEKEREKERERERERERQRDLELEKQREKEREKERERQRQIELEKQRLIELEKQRQIELEKQREIEREKELERERQKEKEREKERELERQRELEKQREKERAKEKEVEREIPRPIYRFCDDIDESDCDKKISILQERIMALRQTYISLKTKLGDLDRRKICNSS